MKRNKLGISRKFRAEQYWGPVAGGAIGTSGMPLTASGRERPPDSDACKQAPRSWEAESGTGTEAKAESGKGGKRKAESGTGTILTRWGVLDYGSAMPRTARVAPGGMVFHVLNRAWFKNPRFRVTHGISARTLIGPALERVYATPG